MWYETEKPEQEEIPCGYNVLDFFRKLILIRSWSPDRTISQARKYIEGKDLKSFLRSEVIFFLLSDCIVLRRS